MKLGELLVQGGQLNRRQLAKALKIQGLLGGRLGTTLVEESLVAEGEILKALGRQHSTRTVSREELADVPAEVVRMIPARLAGRYGIVPFHLKGRTLWVASKDVGDLLKEDEISFLTSCMVRTCIALELRVDEALERYYRLKAPDRTRALVRRLAMRPAGPATSAASPAKLPREVPPPPRPAASAPKPPASASRPARAGAGGSATVPAAKPRAAPTPIVEQPRFIELDEEDAALLGTSSTELPAWTPPSNEPVVLEPTPLPWLRREAAPVQASVPALTAEPESVPSAQAPSAVEARAPESGDGLDLEERLRRAAAGLRDVEIRDDIGDVLLSFCAPFFRRRAILVTRKDQIVGWRGEGEEVEDQKVRGIVLPAHDPSVFLGLTEPASFWLGALPKLDANRLLVDGLGDTFPRDCVVLPVILRTRVVCYVYGDNLGGGVGGAPIAELRRLVAKAGLAFEVYILKNKLRML